MSRNYKYSITVTFWSWIGIIACILLQLVTCQPAPAQTMYEVEYKSQANLLLYEVDYPAQAHIKYYVVQYKSQAEESE